MSPPISREPGGDLYWDPRLETGQGHFDSWRQVSVPPPCLWYWRKQHTTPTAALFKSIFFWDFQTPNLTDDCLQQQTGGHLSTFFAVSISGCVLWWFGNYRAPFVQFYLPFPSLPSLKKNEIKEVFKIKITIITTLLIFWSIAFLGLTNKANKV